MPANDTYDSTMVAAVSNGSLEIIKLLVEHGADYNFLFGDPPRTPLSQAIDFQHNDVAAYLKSLGAVAQQETRPSSSDTTEMSEEARQSEIVACLKHHTGLDPQPSGLQEIVPGVVNVSVWTVAAPESLIIFTSGMSSRPMVVPDDYNGLRYAELVMFLPKDWPLQPTVDATDAWPWRWLRTIAQFPHENQTWLGGPVATFANGDPPERLAPNCEFTGFLLAYNRDFPSFQSDDARVINLITVSPIYTDELQLARENRGFVELLHRFDEHGILAALQPGRLNVARQ